MSGMDKYDALRPGASEEGAAPEGEAEAGALLGQAGSFVARQALVAVASMDAGGAPWASILFGRPGFLRVAEGAGLILEKPHSERDLADPLWGNIDADPGLGILLAEPGGGRRYRIRGSVRHLDSRVVEVAVRMARSERTNDVQPRALRRTGEPNLPVQAAQGTVLRGVVEHIVRRADTLVAAARHAAGGADIACRSARPGFLQPLDQATLRIAGDGDDCLATLLQGLGGEGRAGICIPDFEHGQLLQLTGTVASRQGQREFHVQRWILRDAPKVMQWELLDAPQL